MNVKLTDAQKIKVLNSADLYAVMRQVLLRENKIRRGREHFWVVGLDLNYKILFIELVSLGASNRLAVKAPEVFRIAIYKQAQHIMMVHNHPGGNIQPSYEDKDMTDMYIKVGQIIHINVMDHLIIAEETYYSFEEQGLMEQLRRSGAYVVKPREETELEALRLQLEKEAAVKENNMEIAARMLAKGKYTTEEIVELTGLKKGVVERLRRGKGE